MAKKGLDVEQFRLYVVRPTLKYMFRHSVAAENLLIGTALVESRLVYLRQLGMGPALGVFQMEPATFNDIYDNYLNYRPDLRALVDATRDRRPTTHAEELMYNMAFATAMCRVHYLRVPEQMPLSDDPAGLAAYWKEYYNTPLGAGTIKKALPFFQRACQ